jgi:hypothetical protein
VINDERQRKSRAAAATLPRRATSSPQVIELALRGLHNMGFSKTDARRAVDHVSQRRVANGDALDVQDLLRGAIAALTWLSSTNVSAGAAVRSPEWLIAPPRDRSHILCAAVLELA